MELEEMQSAWRSLERSFERQQRATEFLMRDRRLGGVQSRLHAFAGLHAAQIALGVALVALGVAVWNRSGITTLAFACGVMLHVFGIVNIAFAGATIVRVASMDYSAPVLEIQRGLARLERIEAINVLVCGLPWWFIWAVVIAALLSLGDVPFDGGSLSAWLATSIGAGAAGFVATWLGYVWAQRSGRPALAIVLRQLVVGTNLRRARHEVDAIARFESEA